jgi:hypothetical protein
MVQQLLIDIYNASEHTKTNIQLALEPKANQLVGVLLDKYNNHDTATLVGHYLRIFASSEILLQGWLDLGHIKKLKKLVLNVDFNVQSDALETMRVRICHRN